jgi:hypothetical protein
LDLHLVDMDTDLQTMDADQATDPDPAKNYADPTGLNRYGTGTSSW